MNTNIEDDVIGTWFARVGVLAVLVGGAFGYRYAVDQGWIGPAARVLLGVMVGIGFLVGGHATRSRSWFQFAGAMSGGGIAILYLSTLAALVRFELIEPPVALVALTAIALLGGGLSVAYDSIGLSVLATIGAFANPFLISAGQPDPTSALTYAVAVDVGIVYLAYAGRWPILNKIALVGSTALFASVITEVGTIEGIGFASALWIIFTTVPFMQILRGRAKANGIDAVLLVAVSALYFSAGMYLLRDEPNLVRGGFTLALSFSCAAFALVAMLDERTRPLMRDVMGAQCIGWLTLAVPIALDGATVPLVWSVQGALLLWLGDRVKDHRLGALSAGFIVVGLLGAVDHISTYEPTSFFATGGAAVSAAYLVSITVSAILVSRSGPTSEEWRPVLGTILMVTVSLLTLSWICREAAYEVRRTVEPDRVFAAIQLTYSVLWASYAAILLVIGILKKIGWARLLGVAVFAVTLVKMISIDIWQLDVLYRMVAFIGLGALLLVCSLMYNRFRELIVGHETS